MQAVIVHRPMYARTPNAIRTYNDRNTCVHQSVYDNYNYKMKQQKYVLPTIKNGIGES